MTDLRSYNLDVSVREDGKWNVWYRVPPTYSVDPNSPVAYGWLLVNVFATKRGAIRWINSIAM